MTYRIKSAEACFGFYCLVRCGGGAILRTCKLKGNAVSPQIEISTQSYRTTALFWGSKKSVKHQPVDSSLGDFTLAGSATQVFFSHYLCIV
ncbi:hypothetical protein V6N13_126770 [Hibiscus sabdariffa]